MTDTSKRELIEEAAKAIHDVAMREYPGMPADIYGWDVQKDRDRDVYLLEARAALRAASAVTEQGENR